MPAKWPEGVGGVQFSLLRVDDHDLTFLAVRAGGAEQEHRLGVYDRHVEGSYGSLTVLERDVTAVNCRRDGLLKRLARRVRRTLCHCVVPIGELELDHIADGGGNDVGQERVLRPPNNHRYNSVAGDLSCLLVSGISRGGLGIQVGKIPYF